MSVCVAWLYNPEHGVRGQFCSSLMNLLAFDAMNDGLIIPGGGQMAVQSGANVTQGRNDCVEKFLTETDDEWLWIVDSDMTFEPHALAQLIEHADPVERPIVGGLCFGRRGGNVFPTLFTFGEDQILLVAEYPDNTMLKVGATGAAFLLVHRSVLEKMEANYPMPWPWFAQEIVDGRPRGEDITFCARAGELGFPIFVHTGVKVGHIKDHELSEDLYVERGGSNQWR